MILSVSENTEKVSVSPSISDAESFIALPSESSEVVSFATAVITGASFTLITLKSNFVTREDKIKNIVYFLSFS